MVKTRGAKPDLRHEINPPIVENSRCLLWKSIFATPYAQSDSIYQKESVKQPFAGVLKVCPKSIESAEIAISFTSAEGRSFGHEPSNAESRSLRSDTRLKIVRERPTFGALATHRKGNFRGGCNEKIF
jgi:hypothetical protein